MYEFYQDLLLAEVRKHWMYPLLKGKTPLQKKWCHGYHTKLNLVMRLLFLSFGEWRVSHHIYIYIYIYICVCVCVCVCVCFCKNWAGWYKVVEKQFFHLSTLKPEIKQLQVKWKNIIKLWSGVVLSVRVIYRSNRSL